MQMREIYITIGECKIHAALRDTPTAVAVYKSVPFDSSAQTWGDEVYFTTPISSLVLEKDAKDIVALGEIAYWVEGNCIAIGFGRTPISRGDEIRLAAKTNIWADCTDDLSILKNVQPGDPIRVTALK